MWSGAGSQCWAAVWIPSTNHRSVVGPPTNQMSVLDHFSANLSSPQTWCCSVEPWPHAELPPLQRQGYQSFKLMRHGLTLEVDGVVVNVEEPLGDDADGEQILIQNLVDELLQLGLSLQNEVTIYDEECC